MKISVILCTHNPRADYLTRTLEALAAQTLPVNEWELLLIDNASMPPLTDRTNLSWHPEASCLVESRTGLTSARLRGIGAARAGLLIFVDDDNLLATDYLAQAARIAANWPMLGAWGGQIRPEFDEPAAEWTRPLWPYLAVREFDADRWSNLPENLDIAPCGAGMCVRAEVAQRYAETVRSDPLRRALDRTGTQLASQGDIDLALTACDQGMGMGQFAKLRLTHLIPKERLTEAYLIRLLEGDGASSTILHLIRRTYRPPTFWGRLREVYRPWRLSGRQRTFFRAVERGVRKGRATFARLQEAAAHNEGTVP